METCVILPRDMSLLLDQNVETPLQLRVGLWTSVRLEPGILLLPDEGEMQQEKLEVFRSLSADDIRFQFGCSEVVCEVEGREVRHCNWVRFLTSSHDLDKVNIVATLAHGQPVFQVVKTIEPSTELVAYFDQTGLREDLKRPLSATEDDTDEEIDVVKDSGYESKSRSCLEQSEENSSHERSKKVPIFKRLRHEPDTPLAGAELLRPLSCPAPKSSYAHALLADSPPQSSTGRRSLEGSPKSDDEIQSMQSGSTAPGSHCERSPVDYSTPIRPLTSRVPLTSSLQLPLHVPAAIETTPPQQQVSVPRLGEASPASTETSVSPQSESSPNLIVKSQKLVPETPVAATKPMITAPVFSPPPAPVFPAKRARERTWLPCEVCGKKFDRPSLLRRHMRTHTGEKPHACDVCGKAFSTSSSLNTHRRIHSGEKPHECPVCGKCFTASSNLYYHRMTHNKDKPHKCTLCTKSFPTPGDLKSHMYVHNGQYPFTCDICHRGFPKQTNLKNHMMQHSGDKPHTCELCGKKFAQQCNLKTHQKTHDDEPQEECRNCGKAFLQINQQLSNGKCRSCVAKSSNPASLENMPPIRPDLHAIPSMYGFKQLQHPLPPYPGAFAPIAPRLLPYPGSPWSKLPVVTPNF